MEAAEALTPTVLDLSRRLDLDLDSVRGRRPLPRPCSTTRSKWWIADLMREAEARFGESAYQIAAATGRSERTLLNWIWVASQRATFTAP